MSTGSFSGLKCGRGVTLTPSSPSSAVGHEITELYLYSPYGPYGLYRASVPVQGYTLPLPLPAVTCLDVNTKWLLEVKFHGLCEVSGFRFDAYEIWALLGIHAAYNGRSLPTFRDLYRIVGNKLPFYAE